MNDIYIRVVIVVVIVCITNIYDYICNDMVVYIWWGGCEVKVKFSYMKTKT